MKKLVIFLGGILLFLPALSKAQIEQEPGDLQFSSDSYLVSEDNVNATIIITRVNGIDGLVTVDYTISPGSASSGLDYNGTTGTVALADGVDSNTFLIPIIDDGEIEGSETVNLVLSNATGGAFIGFPSNAILTIEDEDADNDNMTDDWEETYFGSTNRDGNGDFDGDGQIDLNEFFSGTDPANPTSVFAIKDLTLDGVVTGLVIQWSSESNKFYALTTATNLGDGFLTLTTSIPGTPPNNIYTVTTDSAKSSFYKIKLE